MARKSGTRKPGATSADRPREARLEENASSGAAGRAAGARPETASPARGVAAPAGTTRARIERAALDLFAAEGVDAATTRRIAAAAGLSEGALYRHFPSKEAIARTLFAAIHERLARLVREAGAGGRTIEEKAAAIVEGYARAADDDWTLFAFHLLSTAHFLPTPPGEDNPVAAVEDIVAAAMASGEIAGGDIALRAAMALGAVQQAALHKVYGRVTGNLTSHAPALTRAVIAILRAR